MFSAIWQIWIEMAPWLLLGTLAASLVHVLLPTGFVSRHLSGRLGVLKAVLVGIPLPLCSCAVIPAGLGLKKSGASDGAAVGFLISTPQTGIDSILVSGSLLGWPFAFLKVGVALVTGWAGGIAVGTKEKSATPLAPTPLIVIEPTPNQKPLAQPNRWTAFHQHFFMLIQSLWGWLVIGVLISAAISHWVPEDTISSLPGFTGWPSLLLVLLIAIPMYVCATASVPIAAALVGSGLPAGAALVFLMAGPATNLATIGAVYKTLGQRSLIVYLTSIIVGSVSAGAIFNQVIPTAVVSGHTHLMAPTWWEIATAIALCGLVIWFAFIDVKSVWERFRPASEAPGRRFAIEGMTCNGCAAKLRSSLLADPAINEASVSFATASATIMGEATDEQVRQVTTQAGFSVLTTSPNSQM
ncbi:MAG: permease [Fuerstiella sp.]